VEVQSDQLAVELKAPKQSKAKADSRTRKRDTTKPRTQRAGHRPHGSPYSLAKDTIETAARDHRAKVRSTSGFRPIRAETRAKLVASIARGRRWLDEIVTGAVTDVEQIARRERVDHIIVFSEAQLRRILTKYAAYYNE
jgi:hypothetical protein